MSRGATGYGRILACVGSRNPITRAPKIRQPHVIPLDGFSRFQNRIQSHGRGKKKRTKIGEFECQDALSSVFIMTQLDCPDGA